LYGLFRAQDGFVMQLRFLAAPEEPHPRSWPLGFTA